MSEEAGALLRERADSYASDALRLRSLGMNDEAVLYETLRDELRQVARDVTQDAA